MRILARLLFLPTIVWNIVTIRWLGWYRWWDEIDPHVWLGAMPLRGDAAKLYEGGVRAVVNLCHECRGSAEACQRLGMEVLQLPLTDYTSPGLNVVHQCLDFIERHTARGHIVYVHCKAGRGRGATIVLCWLIYKHGMTPAQAGAAVLAKRPQILRRASRRRVVQQIWAEQNRDASSS